MDVQEISDIIERGGLEKALERIYYLENKQEILDSIIWIGINYSSVGKLDQALDTVQKTLKVCEDLGISQSIALSFSAMGFVHSLKGELELASDNLQKGLSISEKSGAKKSLALTLMCMGYNYYLKGDLNESFAVLQRSLELSEKIEFNEIIAWCLYHTAKIYRARNELRLALDHFNKSLESHKKNKNHYGVANALLRLVMISLDLKAKNQAENYLKQFDRSKMDSNKAISLCMRLSKAMILKAGHRAMHKTDAQRLLQQIVDESIIDYEFTLIAMINLCDLLIDELKMYGEQEVLEGADELVNRIYEVTKDRNSHIVLVETLLLKSRFALVKGDLDNAYKLLDHAYIFADERKLDQLVLKVSEEQKKLDSELIKWKDLIQKGTSIVERLDQVEMKEYIRKAIKTIEQ